MNINKKCTLLREILDSMNLEDRQDAISKYGSYMAISMTVVKDLLESSKEEKWKKKTALDLVHSQTRILNALTDNEESEWTPKKYLDSASGYLSKVSE